jgi:hypothetical protein
MTTSSGSVTNGLFNKSETRGSATGKMRAVITRENIHCVEHAMMQRPRKSVKVFLNSSINIQDNLRKCKNVSIQTSNAPSSLSGYWLMFWKENSGLLQGILVSNAAHFNLNGHVTKQNMHFPASRNLLNVMRTNNFLWFSEVMRRWQFLTGQDSATHCECSVHCA